MHRKVLDALTWSRNGSRAHSSRASSSTDFTGEFGKEYTVARSKKQLVSRFFKDSKEELTLQSVGPIQEIPREVDFDRRIVVSEGESVDFHSDYDSDSSGWSSSDDDYGDSSGNRQRFLVGAGGVMSSDSEMLHVNGPRPIHDDNNDEDEGQKSSRDSTTQERGARQIVYSGSEDSDSGPPVEVRRRRPTVSSVLE